MKYISVNNLSDFEFHDAFFSLSAFDHDKLQFNAIFLNIHKNTEQNTNETDMEIANALLTFDGFDLLSYEPGRAWKQDENGELYTDDPQIILTDESAFFRFSEQLESGFRIYHLGILENSVYFIDAVSKDPFFTVHFTFKNVQVEWDEYKKEAWYESVK